MRSLTLALVMVIAGSAASDPRKTTEAVTVRKKPGEKEAAVAQLPAGTVVVVLAEEGRWLKIRVRNVDGYVTRTTITAATPTPVVAAPSWSAARPGDALTVVVAAASELRAAASARAPIVVQVAQAARLVVVDATTDPRWIQVRDDAGHAGWIDRVALDNGVAASAVDGGGASHGGPDLSTGIVRQPALPFVVHTEAGIGYRALGMSQTANAAGGLTNYVLDADAMAAVLSADMVKRLSARTFVVVDGVGVLSQASPGVAYDGPTSPSGKIPFKTFATDVGAAIGVHAREIFDFAVHAGFHYDAFLASKVDNAGMLPRERLVGATLGARVEIAPPTSRFAMIVRFDALVVGARAQTPGLQDGTNSTARALWGGLKMRAQLTGRWSLYGAYDLGRVTTRWTGASQRSPGVTNASRIDSTQLVQVGVSVSL